MTKRESYLQPPSHTLSEAKNDASSLERFMDRIVAKYPHLKVKEPMVQTAKSGVSVARPRGTSRSSK
jgi:hypothetical protein